MELHEALATIREIPDFPIPGVLFRDITTMLSNPSAFTTVIAALSETADSYEAVAGIEARGFILGSALAQKKGLGFIPIRKKGKLPFNTFSRSYGLEYGSDEIEIHIDAIQPKQNVLLVDDVLATGGTLLAALKLIGDCGGNVSDIAVLLEIESLGGRLRIHDEYPQVHIHALVKS